MSMKTEARIATEIFNCSVHDLHESEFYDSQTVDRARTILEAEYLAKITDTPKTIH